MARSPPRRRAARSASCCARRAPGRAAGPRRGRRPRPRSTRGSRSPRTRRRPPPARASRTRAPGARPARAAAREAAPRRPGAPRRARPPSARSTRGSRAGPPPPRRARPPPWPGPRRPRRRSRRAGVGGVEVRGEPRSPPTRIGTSSGSRASSVAQGLQQRLAHGRAAQLQDRLVPEAHGAASSSSIGVPRCCSPRKDSFEVFSSSRRTR